MDINELTLGQIKEVATVAANIGAACTPQASAPSVTGEIRIVVLQRGWVVVGYYHRSGGRVLVGKASVIRRWGTTKGLGELCNGPLANTTLDPCGDVDAHELAEVLTIKCEREPWAKVLK